MAVREFRCSPHLLNSSSQPLAISASSRRPGQAYLISLHLFW
jgi:hypothetical protein